MITSPFPHIERPDEAYLMTFLESVSLQITYNSAHETFEIFKKFFDGYTGMLALDENRYKEKKLSSLRIKSDNGLVSLKFAKDFVDFTIDGSVYVRFEEMYGDFLKAFSDFLESIGSDVVEMSIDKVNLWPMLSDSDDNINRAVNAVFKADMLTAIPMKSNEMASDVASVQDVDVLVKWGLMKEGDAQDSCIFLDTKSVSRYPFKASELYERANHQNQILYDVFRWAVTDDVIKAMQGNLFS